MIREFIMMPEFDRQWQNMGLDEKDNLSKTERSEIAKKIVRLELGLKKQENKKLAYTKASSKV